MTCCRMCRHCPAQFVLNCETSPVHDQRVVWLLDCRAVGGIVLAPWSVLQGMVRKRKRYARQHEGRPMLRIRFHGCGGQGMKTASRILGAAAFHAGYVVQDAPVYGAERR